MSIWRFKSGKMIWKDRKRGKKEAKERMKEREYTVHKGRPTKEGFPLGGAKGPPKLEVV
jgi:hypothetical protein